MRLIASVSITPCEGAFCCLESESPRSVLAIAAVARLQLADVGKRGTNNTSWTTKHAAAGARREGGALVVLMGQFTLAHCANVPNSAKRNSLAFSLLTARLLA